MTNEEVKLLITGLDKGHSNMVLCPTKPKALVIESQFKALTNHKLVVQSMSSVDIRNRKFLVPTLVIAYIT